VVSTLRRIRATLTRRANSNLTITIGGRGLWRTGTAKG